MTLQCIFQVIWQAPDAFIHDFADTMKASGAMAGLSLVAGLVVGRFMKLSAYDAWPVAFEMMVQNVALAATIAIMRFPAGKIRIICCSLFYYSGADSSGPDPDLPQEKTSDSR